jgi:hypothetical protein
MEHIYNDLFGEVKGILGLSIADTKHDGYFELCVPLFFEFIQDYCNSSFLDDEGYPKLKGGAKIAVAKMVEYNMQKSGITNRKFDEVSYSYSLDFPPSILALLQPYSRIRV